MSVIFLLSVSPTSLHCTHCAQHSPETNTWLLQLRWFENKFPNQWAYEKRFFLPRKLLEWKRKISQKSKTVDLQHCQTLEKKLNKNHSQSRCHQIHKRVSPLRLVCCSQLSLEKFHTVFHAMIINWNQIFNFHSKLRHHPINHWWENKTKKQIKILLISRTSTFSPLFTTSWKNAQF